MGYRELFLVLLSVVLLTTLMVQINASTNESRETLQELEIAHTAASVAQQYLEEIKSKKFDALSDILPLASMPSGFSPYNSLGHGWWETYPNYNDVDDYNGLTRTQTVNGVDYNVIIQVHYVQDTAPDTPFNNETFFKRVTVKVTSSYLANTQMDTIAVKQVFSYFGVN